MNIPWYDDAACEAAEEPQKELLFTLFALLSFLRLKFIESLNQRGATNERSSILSNLNHKKRSE
jgi:hypothetical protein